MTLPTQIPIITTATGRRIRQCLTCTPRDDTTSARPGYIRTSCAICKKFIGYRPIKDAAPAKGIINAEPSSGQ